MYPYTKMDHILQCAKARGSILHMNKKDLFIIYLCITDIFILKGKACSAVTHERSIFN